MDKEVQRTCKFIEKNFADSELCIESICTAMVTGEAFIENLFEKELGVTVSNFIDQVRINRARILVSKNHNLSVADVAEQTGFKTPEHFLDVFGRIVAVSFDEYRSSLDNS